MNRDFIPYEQALALKELGFDEPCFGFWNENNEFTSIEFDVYSGGNLFDLIKNHNNDVHTNAPTFSQAFRFFREKYNLHSIFEYDFDNYYYVIQGINDFNFSIDSSEDGDVHQTYEQAELECLKELIKIVNNEKH